MPGGTEHTAGGKAPEVTVWNALPKLNDFTEFHKRPCVRDALLTGIGGGAAFGGVRAVFGATVWTACSWATGTFCFGSAVMYQYCLYRRKAEKEGMMRAVEILNKKDIDRKAREQRKEKIREERRAAKDVEQDTQLAALSQAQTMKTDGGGGKPWWKVW
ncbi:hypothetical protein BAUCODRAFT_30683 [Baudoinia panamericana UAMH 10762]|uniref:Cytochrome c oxidase assembly protein COX20, mitochondrial n=1 Tax=Baudoinia panamericana (strain UAMH 10762) TaxID=717646 RepID=M2NM17_BAUPA|nr:uncharacterized protein BAUCODRAFT_30683 [Baudoinia panamericana UAMH 10762]EMD00216.1 hypothetical protein BAUCODRAFT_30683 [Baudoinia panamericana UAMH 10762]